MVITIQLTSLEGQSTSPVNFEGAQTSPVRLSPDGTRLFAVNTAHNALSVFDVSTPTAPVWIAEIPVGLEPVSVNPRTNDEAWVVNQLSDSVSIVSVSRGIVTATLRAGDEPMDVVFAGPDHAYVSASRDNAVVVFDAETKIFIDVLPLFGGNPRALAVSRDGTRVYAAFALAGNGTTVIPDLLAPPPPPPTNPNLPPAPQVAKIISADDPIWWPLVTYAMPQNGVAVITADASPNVGGYYRGVGTVNLGVAVNPVNGDIWVTNTHARNLVTFEPNLRGHWVDNRVTRINWATSQVTPFDLNPDIDYTILPNPAALASALAQPTALTFEPFGRFMYVAAYGTDRIARVDVRGNVLSFIEVSPASGSGPNADPANKRGPRGLALRPDGRTLYALNRISNTISVIDTVRSEVVREVPVGTDNTPDAIRLGRGFLYDAKLSGNGTGSCASCHIDGDMDMLAWDLGDPGGEMASFEEGGRTFVVHPMKGPMTTQSLRGLAGTGRLHWRGDRATLLDFNPAFSGLMGGLQLADSDMLAFAVFVQTMLYQPNPYQRLDRSLPPAIGVGDPAAGRQAFLADPLTPPGVTCASCHAANPGPGTNALMSPDSGTVIRPVPMKTPHLRNMYQKLLFSGDRRRTIAGFGMHHDGHVFDFAHFFRAPGFGNYSLQQKIDIGAYLRTFDTGTAPAVGYTVTLSRINVDTPSPLAEWSLLEQQSALRNIDVVAHGTINGQVNTLLYRPFFNDYAGGGVPRLILTREVLRTLIQRGDTITLIGVPPREGLNPQFAESARALTSRSPERRSANRGH
jgi:YVTN family beta-propeller protein